MEIERRRSERIGDDIPVLLVRAVGETDVWNGVVADLSADGARVFTERKPEVDTIMYAGFFVDGPGSTPVIAKVHVVWSRPEGTRFAFGLSFLSDSPAQRRAIARMRAHIARRKREQREAATHA